MNRTIFLRITSKTTRASESLQLFEPRFSGNQDTYYIFPTNASSDDFLSNRIAAPGLGAGGDTKGELDVKKVAMKHAVGDLGLLAPFAAAPRHGPAASATDAQIDEWASSHMKEVNALANTTSLTEIRRMAKEHGLSKSGGRFGVAKRLVYYYAHANT